MIRRRNEPDGGANPFRAIRRFRFAREPDLATAVLVEDRIAVRVSGRKEFDFGARRFGTGNGRRSQASTRATSGKIIVLSV